MKGLGLEKRQTTQCSENNSSKAKFFKNKVTKEKKKKGKGTAYGPPSTKSQRDVSEA